ncbi:hypothetical protein [Rhodoferax sp. GW822-FHT02A01]|uniref:hypothetical protein n=1 Tax=Rhodoferax sp. GW822-FHT02A01 TaxID=3141537 RepID=UPI00315CB8E3
MEFTNSDWINLGAAIGSITAAIVALGLGINANWRNTSDARGRAKLYAASVATRLSHTEDVITNCLIHCEFKNLDLSDDESNRQALIHISITLRAGIFRPDIDTLQGLIALGGNCANRIASAFDSVDLVLLYLADLNTELFVSGGRSPVARKNLLDKVHANLSHAQELLRVALRECVNASQLAAPKPSSEELYGPGEP